MNAKSPCLRFRRSEAHDVAVSTSAPEGTRTPNLLIRSQMLYPLSYGRLSILFSCAEPRSGVRIRGSAARSEDEAPGQSLFDNMIRSQMLYPLSYGRSPTAGGSQATTVQQESRIADAGRPAESVPGTGRGPARGTGE